MVRQIFKNRVLAAAGPLPGQYTVENIKHWTRIRKGVFSDEFDENVTHLLCTEEQFKKRVPRIKKALKKDNNRVHIIHYDWFDFSIFHEKRQPEREFSMRNILAQQKAKDRENARIEKGKKDGEKFVNTNLFHIYHDREFFPYRIDITRDDEESGELGQRYTICLWESDAKPHLYWFTAKFLKKKGSSQPSYHRPSPCAGKWRPEMNLFLDFFRQKTKIDWEDRVIMQGTTAPDVFQYAPPTGGKPVGRRLRHSHDYCLEINAQLRGLPWPPPEEVSSVTEISNEEESSDVDDDQEDAKSCSDEDIVNKMEVDDDQNITSIDDTSLEADTSPKDVDMVDTVPIELMSSSSTIDTGFECSQGSATPVLSPNNSTSDHSSLQSSDHETPEDRFAGYITPGSANTSESMSNDQAYQTHTDKGSYSEKVESVHMANGAIAVWRSLDRKKLDRAVTNQRNDAT